MTKATAMVTMVVALLAVTVAIAAAQSGTGTQDCVSKLVPCVDYVNGTKPSTECCDSIKEAVAKQLSCLCNVYTTPGLLQSFNVSVDQALKLTRNCGVPVQLDQCKSAQSPQPQTLSPPGVPGGDNGAERTAIAGIFAVFLLFVSTLFY